MTRLDTMGVQPDPLSVGKRDVNCYQLLSTQLLCSLGAQGQKGQFGLLFFI